MDMRMGSIFRLKRDHCAVVYTILTFTSFLCVSGSSNLPSGHLKPFGCCNPVKGGVTTVEGWPHPITFFKNHVIPQKPLLFKNAAKVSPAYTLWTDEYFVNMDVPPDAKVAVEDRYHAVKREHSKYIDFKDWVGQYNATEKYMIQEIPAYLAKDVVLPPSLQCKSFIDNAMVFQSYMWFSGSGTKSVVHTDDVHNLNCLYSGSKQFILVDHTLYPDKVPLDAVEGLFSTLDVDRVDFEKYTTLAGVEYYNVTMEAGDCLFLPVEWIHQVNSYDRNIAVNVWFYADAGERTDLSTCLDEFDPSITLDKVPKAFIADKELLEFITKMLTGYFKKYGKITFDQFERGLIIDYSGYLSQEAGAGYKSPLKKLFKCIDKNIDDIVTEEEYKEATEDDWRTFRQLFRNLLQVLQDIFKDQPDLYNAVLDNPIFEQDELFRDEGTRTPAQGQGGKNGDGKGSGSFKEEL